MACFFACDVVRGHIVPPEVIAKDSIGSTTIPEQTDDGEDSTGSTTIPEHIDDGEESEISSYDELYDGEITLSYLRRHHAAQGADAPRFSSAAEKVENPKRPVLASRGRDQRSRSSAPKRSSSTLGRHRRAH